MTDALNDWVSVEAAVVAARLGGMSLAALCSAFGLGECQTKNVLRRHGLIEDRRSCRRMGPEDVRRICELRDAGMEYREIVRETGWSKGSVGAALKRRERRRMERMV